MAAVVEGTEHIWSWWPEHTTMSDVVYVITKVCIRESVGDKKRIVFGKHKRSVKNIAGRNQSVERGRIQALTLSSYVANPMLRIKASTNMVKAEDSQVACNSKSGRSESHTGQHGRHV